MRKTFPVSVTANPCIAPNAWLLKFRRPFDFVAGQVIGITLNPGNEPRLYSIASGIQEKEVWILYTVKPDGLLTPPLSEVKKGETIFITEPFGNFICKEEKATWIATGTGIAPFASMFFSGQQKGKTLIQGAPNEQGLYFSKSFRAQSFHPYITCTSREGLEGNFHGRVTDYLQQLPALETDIPYYLCGIAEMVVDVRDILISRDVPFNNIMAEIFF